VSGFKTPEYVFRGNGEAVVTPAEWVEQQLPPGSIREAPKSAGVIDRLGDWLVLGKKQGGWGEVYLCVPSQGARLAFALKSYPPAKARTAIVRSVFEHECVTSMLVSSAFGVLPYSVDVIDGRLFLVMPAGDASLRDKLDRGSLPFDEAISTARVVAIALHEAARCVPGLVHGDLKPENVLMVYGVPHVADFGLARSAARWAGADALQGTEEYRAPEAGDPAAALSVSADVYSYGVLLAELLGGAAPRRGPGAWLRGGRSREQETRQALLGLATRCRARSPRDRPADFAAVCGELDEIVPEATWPLPREALVMRAISPLVSAAGMADVMIAAGLQRLGQHAMVLDLVARTAPTGRQWQLWMREGIALSELGRDEEALRSYKAAIELLDQEDPPQAEQRWTVLLQAAISLKRLRHYDEAQEMLNTLVVDAPDDASAVRAMWNVAGVWADSGRDAEAELLMAQLLMGNPGMAEEASMWAKLAIVRLDVGDPLRAADALRRATAVEPAVAEWHDRLGCLLMGVLGWVDEAGVEFRNALDCGSLDREVFISALTCARAVGDEASQATLLRRLGAALGEDATQDAAQTAEFQAFWWLRKFGGPDGPAGGDLPAGMADALAAAGLADLPAGDPPRPARQADPAPAAAGETSLPDLGDTGGASPRLQLLVTATGIVYMDFYQPFSAEDFVQNVATYRRLALIKAAEEGGRLAQTQLHLLRCPTCAVEVASNRLPGSKLRCQHCHHEYQVTPLPGEDRGVGALARALAEAVTRPAKPMDGCEVLVAVQLLPTAPFRSLEVDAAAELAVRLKEQLIKRLEAGGVVILPPTIPGVQVVASYGVAQGALRPDVPWVGGSWRCPPGSVTGVTGGAPDQLIQIIDEASRVILPARLASVTLPFDASSGSPLSLLLLGHLDQAEEALRSREAGSRDGTDAFVWLSLAFAAQLSGDPKRALRLADAARMADPRDPMVWTRIGSIRLSDGDVKGAAAAAEYALVLNPGDSQACQVLALAYQRLVLQG